MLLPNSSLGITSVVVCTDLSGKEPHRQIGMVSIVIDIREPKWCNGYHTTLEGKRCGFDSHSRCIISHFHHTHDTRIAQDGLAQ